MRFTKFPKHYRPEQHCFLVRLPYTYRSNKGQVIAKAGVYEAFYSDRPVVPRGSVELWSTTHHSGSPMIVVVPHYAWVNVSEDLQRHYAL